MMITKLEDLITAAQQQHTKKRIVVAYAQDAHTLEAVSSAVDLGVVSATLIGDRHAIIDVCRICSIDHSKFTIVECDGDTPCVNLALKMIADGGADILMKGLVSTDKYMRGILSKEFGLVPPKGVLSHVVVLELPQYHKLLTISDVAVIPYPDITQKTAMTKYLISTAQALGVDSPKVACIAPSEQMLPGIVSCVDSAILAKMGDRGQLGRAIVDGPLALDTAMFKDVAETKKLTGSSVAGDPDCLLFPNIDAANVFFKSATKLCSAELAAMVVGTKVPCVLTSRGDSKLSKLYSIALAALFSAQRGKGSGGF